MLFGLTLQISWAKSPTLSKHQFPLLYMEDNKVVEGNNSGEASMAVKLVVTISGLVSRTLEGLEVKCIWR